MVGEGSFSCHGRCHLLVFLELVSSFSNSLGARIIGTGNEELVDVTCAGRTGSSQCEITTYRWVLTKAS